MLMQSQGVGVELSREEYESGNWAGKVKEAWRQGRRAKDAKRKAGDDPKRHADIDDMAMSLLQWVKRWQA
jgi:hypothetical protein